MVILDAIFNIFKRSLMSEWHQLDSSSTIPEQQKSTKKNTLNPRLKAISYYQTIHTELHKNTLKNILG